MTVTKYKTKSGIRYKVKFNHDRTVHLKKGLATRQEAKEWEAAERDRIYTGGMRSNQTVATRVQTAQDLDGKPQRR
mgnify:CR=1 FL=1